MAELLILFDSQMGNTEKMTQAVAEGARACPKLKIESPAKAKGKPRDTDKIVFYHRSRA